MQIVVTWKNTALALAAILALWSGAEAFRYGFHNEPAKVEDAPSQEVADLPGASFHGCGYSKERVFDPFYTEMHITKCVGNTCYGDGYSTLGGSFKVTLTAKRWQLDGEYQYVGRTSHGSVVHHRQTDGSLIGKFMSSTSTLDNGLINGEIHLVRGTAPIGGDKREQCENAFREYHAALP